MRFPIGLPAAASLLPLLLLVSGCSTSFAPAVDATPSKLGTIAGRAFGGQQPITGAHLYVYAAGTAGYGGASVSRLTAASVAGSTPTVADSNGNYYVVTDSKGNFTISGEYTCVAGSQIYLYLVQGNSGGGNNTGIGLMAVLGQCPAAGNLAAVVPYVWINEVSTVVAAYTLAGFATDATHVSDDEAALGNTTATLAKTGMANAFAEAAVLKSVALGTANTTTANGIGALPQTTIDTLANILASCVNATGPAAGGCPTLFADAANGTVTPTDTATAAINIAHNPGVNVAALYNLQVPTLAFAPALTSAPNDFVVGIVYTPLSMQGPGVPVIDASGDVWFANFYNNNVTELSSLGAELSPLTTGYTGGGLKGPSGAAIDQAGNVWIANGTGTSMTELTGAGAAVSPAAGYPTGLNLTPEQIAIDQSGTPWLTVFNSYVLHFSAAGTVLASYSGAPVGGIAIDTSGNVWFDNQNGTVKLISPAYTASNTTIYNEYQNGGVNLSIDASGNEWSNTGELSKTGALIGSYPSSANTSRYGTALDGLGNVWTAIKDSTETVGEFTNTLVQLSPINNYGYDDDLFFNASGIAVDGSGNVWVSGGWITEMVGAATPVVTPISVGLSNSKLATRP